MSWLTSLNKYAGAGEVQLTYYPDQGIIDVVTHLGAGPKFASVDQEYASDFLRATLRSARLGLVGSEADELVARAIETGYSEASVVEAYMSPEFPDRDKRAGRGELAEFLFTIAENLTNDVISGIQFDRSGFGRYVISGPPDDYYQYVALRMKYPPLNQRDTAKVAVLVRAQVESYISNSLLVNGKPVKHGQISSEIYSVSMTYAGLVDSAEQLVGAVKAALDRDLDEPERALVEAVFGGDQTVIMETLWEVSPEGAYMAPQGLPAPVMPGQTYPVGVSKKRPIPIRIIGQDGWAKPPPGSWYEKIRGRTPEVPDEISQVRNDLAESKNALYYIDNARDILQGSAQEARGALAEQIGELKATGASDEDIRSVLQGATAEELAQVSSVWSDLITVISDTLGGVARRMGQDIASIEPATYEDASVVLARLRLATQGTVEDLTDRLETLRKQPAKAKPWPLTPGWMKSWKGIQRNIPINTLELAIEEYPGDLGSPITFDQAKDFFEFLLRPDPATGLPVQKGIGDVSKPRSSAHWIAWWLSNWGEVPPEDVYGRPALEEEPEEPEREIELEHGPHIPWTQR